MKSNVSLSSCSPVIWGVLDAPGFFSDTLRSCVQPLQPHRSDESNPGGYPDWRWHGSALEGWNEAAWTNLLAADAIADRNPEHDALLHRLRVRGCA